MKKCTSNNRKNAQSRKANPNFQHKLPRLDLLPVNTSEAQAALKSFKAGSLQLIEVGFIGLDTGEIILPSIKLQAFNRPDLLDLARVHIAEGAFDIKGTWDFAVHPGTTSLARLSVEIIRPVKTTFSVCFDLGRYEKFLRQAAHIQKLSIWFSPKPITEAIGIPVCELDMLRGIALYHQGKTLVANMRGV